MNGLLHLLLYVLADRSRDSRRETSRPRQTVVVGPKPTTTIVPPPRQAWDEKRWHRFMNAGKAEMVGAYRIFDRRRRTWRQFDGRIIQQQYEFATYIADPPPEVKHHQHGHCLQLIRTPWFRLHWNRPPKTVDDALLYVERLLDEAINGR